MATYYCKEDAINLLKLEIKGFDTAIEAAQIVMETLKEFDGKVINKRFESALQEKNQFLYARKNPYDTFNFYLNLTDRSVRTVSGECVNYIKNYAHIFFSGPVDKLFPNKRIDAEILCDRITTRVSEFQEERDRLEDSLQKIDEWIEQWESLKASVKELRNEIPYLVGEYVTELHIPYIY